MQREMIQALQGTVLNSQDWAPVDLWGCIF